MTIMQPGNHNVLLITWLLGYNNDAGILVEQPDDNYTHVHSGS